MYLSDDVQKTLRELGKITEKEVVKKQGDLYIAINVLTSESRILLHEAQLIESLTHVNNRKNILKG